MRMAAVVSCIFFLCMFLVEAGCEPALTRTKLPPKTDTGFNASVYAQYTPVKIDILPLTEFVSVRDDEEGAKINVYVSLLDCFGCQIKTPGVFRFELYERVERSAEPKGGRIVIWSDIDLTDAAKNDEHWRDFLRAYEFELDFLQEVNRSCILQATCLCPNGKRLSAEFGLKFAE